MRKERWEIRLVRALKERQTVQGLWQAPDETEAFQAGVMRAVARQRCRPVSERGVGFSEAVWRLAPLTSLATGGLAVLMMALSHGSDDLLNLVLMDTSVYVEHLVSYVF
ncbi:hypothetical protein [Desulfoluna spongiiphila]|uniref:Uncharacterized protein n=1 Tax=Desulfoluna spongiiphila TaxID=419481 RepID=A0A1G5GE59_9BACT|nr:hypothetical protein [Desulfoluna spongiiphila]SCY49804.1 hypothetical protein SAMN05216233_110108 [Desulfoluna spongiiphila]